MNVHVHVIVVQLPSVESPRSDHGGFRYEATGQIYVSSQGLTLASHMKDPLDAIREEEMGEGGDVFYDEDGGQLLMEGEGDGLTGEGERYRGGSQSSITSDEQKQGEQSFLHTCTHMYGTCIHIVNSMLFPVSKQISLTPFH